MHRTAMLLAAALLAVPAARAAAQQTEPMPAGHAHVAGMTHGEQGPPPPVPPREGGQSAFAAIAEIVAILQNDPATDWSQVDLEALRAHLIDMDDVTLHAVVANRPIEGGIEARVTGTGRVVAAIRRMSHAHAVALAAGPAYRMSVEDVAGGVLVRIVAVEPAAASRVRGLGFIGILASDSHHVEHHLALARGVSVAGHAH